MLNRIFSLLPIAPMHIVWLMSIPALAQYWGNSMGGFWITAYALWFSLGSFISFVVSVLILGYILNPHSFGGSVIRLNQSYINKSEKFGIFWFTYLGRLCLYTMSAVFIYMSFTALIEHQGFMSLIWYICAVLYPKLHDMLLHALNPDCYRQHKLMSVEIAQEARGNIKNFFKRE